MKINQIAELLSEDINENNGLLEAISKEDIIEKIKNYRLEILYKLENISGTITISDEGYKKVINQVNRINQIIDKLFINNPTLKDYLKSINDLLLNSLTEVSKVQELDPIFIEEENKHIDFLIKEYEKWREVSDEFVVYDYSASADRRGFELWSEAIGYIIEVLELIEKLVTI